MQYNFVLHSTFYTENQLLVCDENNKVFYLETMDASFAKIKIDGGVEKGSLGNKCDYLVIKSEIENIEIFIELKGSDIKKAMQQLLASYDKYATKNLNVKHYSAIVHSRYPKIDTSMQKAGNNLIKKFKNNVLKHEKILETKYNSNKNEIVKIN